MNRIEAMNKCSEILCGTNESNIQINGFIIDRKVIQSASIFGTFDLTLNGTISISYDDIESIVATKVY